MDDPIPMLNPAEFGSYENSLAARVEGFRAARGTSRLDIIGHFAETDEDEDGGEGPVTTDKTGHFVNSAQAVPANSRPTSEAAGAGRRCAKWPFSPRTRRALPLTD